jgi:hypothetical protein
MNLIIKQDIYKLLQIDDIYFYDYIYYPQQRSSGQLTFINELKHYYNIFLKNMYNCFSQYYTDTPTVESYVYKNSLNNFQLLESELETNYQKNIQIAHHYIVISKNPNEIENPILHGLENICFVLYTYKDIINPNYIDIYNVCAGMACKGQKILYQGIQQSVVKIVMDKLLDLYSGLKKISLFVDFLKNPRPVETSSLYISIGFGNPRLSSKLNIQSMPTPYPELKLDYKKEIKQYNQIQKNKILENINIIYNKFREEISTNIIKINISKNIFEYLENIISRYNYEVCGIFQLSQQVGVDLTNIPIYNLKYICDYEIYGSGNTDSKSNPIPEGFKYMCQIHKTPITYHTHPKSYNNDRNMKFGFFSAGDLVVYITNILESSVRKYEEMAKPYNMLFLVYSKEGLYTLQGNSMLHELFNYFNLHKENQNSLNLIIYLFFGIAIMDITSLFPNLNLDNIGPYEYINIINNLSIEKIIKEGYNFIKTIVDINSYQDVNSIVYNYLKRFKDVGQYSDYILYTLEKHLPPDGIIKKEIGYIIEFLRIMINHPYNHQELFNTSIGINILINTKNIRIKYQDLIKSLKEIIGINNINKPIFITNFIDDFTDNKNIESVDIYYYNIEGITLLQDNLLEEQMLYEISFPNYSKYEINGTGIKAAEILEKKKNLQYIDTEDSKCILPINPGSYKYII